MMRQSGCTLLDDLALFLAFSHHVRATPPLIHSMRVTSRNASSYWRCCGLGVTSP